MHECIPPMLHSRVLIPKIHIEEYFHEHIVVEHVDCHEAYIGRVSVCSGHCNLQTAYVDLVLPVSPCPLPVVALRAVPCAPEHSNG